MKISGLSRCLAMSDHDERENPVADDAQHEASENEDENELLHGNGNPGLSDCPVLARAGAQFKAKNRAASL